MNQPEQQDAPAPPPLAADPEDPSHVLLRGPTEVRSVALVVLTVLAVLATLKWASAFLIPVMIGVMFSYALSPIVDQLERLRIPRAISAAVLILGILGGTGASVWAFSDDANQLVASLPEAAKKLRDSMRRTDRSDNTLGTVQKAAAQLEQAAQDASAATPTARGVQRVVVEKAAFNIRDHLWSGTIGLASLIGQVVVVTFLTYFMLMAGDTFRRKLVKIAGPTLTHKKVTVQALNEITQQIQTYLMVQLVTSVIVGVATGLSFWALGLKQAVVWGIVAGALNLIPYIGSVVVAGAAALVAFVQFGEIRTAAAAAGISLFIHTLMGNLIAPWLTSKTNSMNPVAVFVAVLGWGWLWGVPGLLLGIPIMVVVKAICDRVDDLKPVGEFLGN